MEHEGGALTQHLSKATLESLVQARNVSELDLSDLSRLFKEQITKNLPESGYQIDPRNGDRILYHASRAVRPHDEAGAPTSSGSGESECAICRGETTGILDVAELSEGFTFINKNLYPVLYPFGRPDMAPSASATGERVPLAQGMHFLQWTSTFHDRDWHNMPIDDLRIVAKRLAALEGKLLSGSAKTTADPHAGTLTDKQARYVMIVKNYGRSVGASLSHGHQQIAFSNVMPRRFLDHLRFREKHGKLFSEHLLANAPTDLVVKDYAETILMVPYFMRRPYDMILVVKDTHKSFLHELTEGEIEAVAKGWHDASSAIHRLLPTLGMEIAYNVIVNSGPGTSLYFEFHPQTQPMGGFERLGLFVCQEVPEKAADWLRRLVSQGGEASDTG